MFLVRDEVIEQIKKDFLTGFFAGEKLYVVEYQYIDTRKLTYHSIEFVLFDPLDDFVDELGSRKIDDDQLGMQRHQCIGGSLEEMRLTQSDITIEKKRIVSLSGRLTDGLEHCIGHLTRRSDYKI